LIISLGREAANKPIPNNINLVGGKLENLIQSLLLGKGGN